MRCRNRPRVAYTDINSNIIQRHRKGIPEFFSLCMGWKNSTTYQKPNSPLIEIKHYYTRVWKKKIAC